MTANNAALQKEVKELIAKIEPLIPKLEARSPSYTFTYQSPEVGSQNMSLSSPCREILDELNQFQDSGIIHGLLSVRVARIQRYVRSINSLIPRLIPATVPQMALAQEESNDLGQKLMLRKNQLADEINFSKCSIEIGQSIQEILQIPHDSIERREQLGEDNALIELSRLFQRIQNALKSIPQSVWRNQDINGSDLQTFAETLKELNKIIENEIPSFTNSSSDDTKISLANRMQDQWEQIQKAKLNILPSILNEIFPDAKKMEQMLKKQEQNISVSDALLEKQKETSAEITTKGDVKRIEAVKKSYGYKAWWWLGGSAVALLIAIAMPIIFMLPCLSLADDAKSSQIWNFFSTKAFLLVLSLGVLYVCVRNYLAMQHNYVVNEHRAEALATYETMKDLAGTPDARNIILTLAVSSIYSAQDTGFVKSNVGGSQTQLPVINQILAAVRQKTLPDGD